MEDKFKKYFLSEWQYQHRLAVDHLSLFVASSAIDGIDKRKSTWSMDDQQFQIRVLRQFENMQKILLNEKIFSLIKECEASLPPLGELVSTPNKFDLLPSGGNHQIQNLHRLYDLLRQEVQSELDSNKILPFNSSNERQNNFVDISKILQNEMICLSDSQSFEKAIGALDKLILQVEDGAYKKDGNFAGKDLSLLKEIAVSIYGMDSKISLAAFFHCFKSEQTGSSNRSDWSNLGNFKFRLSGTDCKMSRKGLEQTYQCIEFLAKELSVLLDNKLSSMDFLIHPNLIKGFQCVDIWSESMSFMDWKQLETKLDQCDFTWEILATQNKSLFRLLMKSEVESKRCLLVALNGQKDTWAIPRESILQLKFTPNSMVKTLQSKPNRLLQLPSPLVNRNTYVEVVLDGNYFPELNSIDWSSLPKNEVASSKDGDGTTRGHFLRLKNLRSIKASQPEAKHLSLIVEDILSEEEVQILEELESIYAGHKTGVSEKGNSVYLINFSKLMASLNNGQYRLQTSPFNLKKVS